MKREFLKELGLADEAIDKIMAENGKDIEAQKALTTAEAAKLTTANQTIKDLQETVKKFDGVDVEKLKGDLTALQTKYDADTAALRMDAALDSALADAKVKSPKLLKNSLDREKLKLDGEKLLGLDEQLEAFKKSDPYLFDDAAPPAKSTAKVSSGGTHSSPAQVTGESGKTVSDRVNNKMAALIQSGE